jgi:tRNA dimethylallyltransferase
MSICFLSSSNNTFVPSSPPSILIVICGPTATGKSGLALNLAQSFNGIILSADSRQIYREFDIGTAKPSTWERQLVPHDLIDICEPTEILTVAEYQSQSMTLIQQIHLQGRLDNPNHLTLPLLVGGTGLYIKSVVRGLKIPRVAPQSELRSQLQQLGQPQCYSMLQQVDPIAANKIHPNDVVRTIRALEVFYVTGEPISVQQGEYPPTYPILQIGLDCYDGDAAHTDPLTLRIAQRTTAMVKAGLVEEVEYLRSKYGSDLPLLGTLGYQEMGQYLEGKISLPEAQELTVIHTRQFAKRQRTWFRADRQIIWFDADDPNLLSQVTAQVEQFINACI